MRISESLERKGRRQSAGSVVAWLARAGQEALEAGPSVPVMFGAALVLGVFVLGLYQQQGLTLIYGDSAGHLYIARRTIDSLTPSFAQLGGIWLPLPHVLMIPLVWEDTLWRTGLAGGIVSTRPWHDTQLIPFLMWMLWLK